MTEIFEILRKVMSAIIAEKGEKTLRFFALVKRNDVEDKWDLLISADWLEKSNSQNDLIYIIDKLKFELNTNLNFLTRIVLLKPNEPFMRDLSKANMRSKIEVGEISNYRINDDFVIGKMQIFASNLEGLEPEVVDQVAKENSSSAANDVEGF